MNVPPNPMNWQAIIENHLTGLPVQVQSTGLIFSNGITPEQFEEIGERLLRLSKEVTCALNFMLGDLYNALPCEQYGDRSDTVRAMFGDCYLNKLKNCGWVAGKWNLNRRRSGVSWEFYKVTACCNELQQMDYLHKYMAGRITIKQIAAEKRGGKDLSKRIDALVSELREIAQDDAFCRRLVLEAIETNFAGEKRLRVLNSSKDTETLPGEETWSPAETMFSLHKQASIKQEAVY